MAHCMIVGAGPGLGEAIARRFGAHAHKVSLIARSPDALEAMAQRLKALCVDAAWESADAGDAEALASAITTLETRRGGCTTLVYNAAVLANAGPLALDAARLRREFEVNLVGGLVAAQTVAKGMVARGTGAILFTSGGLALEPYPEWTSLALGKAALRSLAFSLNKALAPQGVHVGVIAVCGVVDIGGPFDPDVIAKEYWRLSQASPGAGDRELIFQPAGSDPFYNDPSRTHRDTTIPPAHVRDAPTRS